MLINKISPVYQLKHEILSSSSGIILINADKTPPHLGVYSKSKYYSLSVNDVHIGTSIEVILQYIHRKRIPAIFIRLKYELEEKVLDGIFSKYEKLEGQSTCFHPIKEIFRNNNINLEQVNFIFDLIPVLKEKGWIKSYHQLYAKDHLIDLTFTLKTYSIEDIYSRINLLSNDKG